jgi:O-antigen/teichoic acid export membrane protein
VLFGILIFAFRAAYDPIMMKLMADKTKEHFSRVSRESWTFYLCLLLPLLLYIYAVPYVFPYLIDEKFNAALKLIPILCLATFLTGCTNILGLGIAYTKRTKYMSYAQVCAFIVFISLVYPLINMYGSLGAAIVYLVSVTVQNIAIYFFSNRLIPIDYAMGKSALVIGVMAFAICIPVVWLQVVAFCGAAVYFGRQIQKNRLLALLSNT